MQILNNQSECLHFLKLDQKYYRVRKCHHFSFGIKQIFINIPFSG